MTDNQANTTLKKEMLDKSMGEPGSSRRPIELDEDEESSDGDNSVIILDSDTEQEDAARDDDDEEEANDEEDSEEEEEDEDEEESEDSDSDSYVDSDSVNSVWSTIDEADGEQMTTEAAEAEIIKKFNKAMLCIAEKEDDRAKKILEKLLEDPIVSTYKIEDPDYEVIEEPPRLARMLQVYIQVHKQLAKLIPEEEVSHMCQVLAYEPNNASLWLDVAMKSVDDGDVNFAKYAFKRCESLKESYEAHATLLFVCCEYGQCLEILKTYQEEMDGLNDKMKYLKFKIRNTSHYYKLMCDRMFGEDDTYGNVTYPDQRKIMVFDERIQFLIEKVKGKQVDLTANEKEKEAELMKLNDLEISIGADQDLPNVCTLLCDIFDRINMFSHPRRHLIRITEWEPRQDYLDVVETVASMVDIVECVEDLTEKVEEQSKLNRGKKRKRNKEQKKEYLANWKKRLFVDKATGETESEANTADEEEEEESQDEEDGTKKSGMPDNELANEFNLYFEDLDPITTGGRTTREKTPPPSCPLEFIDCDCILSHLSAKFSSGIHTILEILEGVLFEISAHSPAHGALPEAMKEVTREMYNRLSMFVPIIYRQFHDLNVLAMELDCRKAMEIVAKKYLSLFHRSKDETDEENVPEVPEESREHLLRFLWKYTSTELRDDIKLGYLYEIRGIMEPEEVLPTSFGSFATWDVELAIDELEKKKRTESVKELWSSRSYKELVVIIENDIDFNSIANEEIVEMLRYWTQSLEKLKKTRALTVLAARALHFYLFSEFKWSSTEPNRLENLVESLLMKLFDKSFRKVDKEVLSSLGYLICVAIKKFPKKIEKNWKNWAILYEIVKVRRGPSLEYLETLDKDSDPHAMPLLEMDLLVKAHEVLGEIHCCSQDNYNFLLFIIDRFREMTEDIQTLEVVYEKDGGFLWNNLNEELSQVLFCMYGKYGRKRKATEDHENGGHCTANLATARRVIPVILVPPLPLYDEKEKLTHDVIELINSKYPFLLKVDSTKKKNIEEFSAILKASKCKEDVNKGLKKCRGPQDEEDSIQSLVWYAMALNSYRASAHGEAVKYAELYLLTEDSATEDRLRGSIWGMLAHGNHQNLFQRSLHEIHEQWKWRIMPFRMAVDAQEHEPVPHFEFAATLYQIASSLSRFFGYLPDSDPRKQEADEIPKLRCEAREQLDRSLELTKLGDDGSQPEHQWLCYFFTGKLEAKSSKSDIVKVVESFYEAACGCELTGFYYPQKVQTKKQTNFEPLEVHYQVHAAVYKYLLKNSNVPMATLRKLLVFLKLMADGHKVVKPSNSLFKVNPDVYATVDSLVFETVQAEPKDGDLEVDEVEETRKELKMMCQKAFTLVTDKFPHIKSYFRLAQIAFERGQLNVASENIFKNVFKRKKRDDGMFDNIVEISCTDISRNGSSYFHIWRCLNLGVQVAQRLLDLHNIVAVLVTMVNIIANDDEEHVLKVMWKTVITLNLEAMEQVVHARDLTRNTPSPGSCESGRKRGPHLSQSTLRCELWRLWNALQKCSKPDDQYILMMKMQTEEVIKHVFKSLAEFRNLMTSVNNDGSMRKKYTVQKRKIEMTKEDQLKKDQLGGPADLSLLISKYNAAANSAGVSSQLAVGGNLASILQKTQAAAVAAAAASSAKPVAAPQPQKVPSQPVYLPLSDSDDDIQCIEPPPAKKAAISQPSTSKPSTSSSIFPSESSKAPAPALAPIIHKPQAVKPTQQPVAPKPIVSAAAPRPQPAIAKPQASKPTTSVSTKNLSELEKQQQQQQAFVLAFANSTPAQVAQLQQAITSGLGSSNENTRKMAMETLKAVTAAPVQAAKASADAQKLISLKMTEAFIQAAQAKEAQEKQKKAQQAQQAKMQQQALIAQRQAEAKRQQELKAKQAREQKAAQQLKEQQEQQKQMLATAQMLAKMNPAQQAQFFALAQAQAQAQSKPQAQVQAKIQAQGKSPAQPKTQAQLKAIAQANAQAQLKAQAQAKAEAQAKAQAHLKAQAQAKTEALAKAQAQALAKAKLQAEALSRAQAAQAAKAQSQPTIVRPTPMRPVASTSSARPITASASTSQLQARPAQPAQQQRMAGRPPHASASTSSLASTSSPAPVRPNPVRPTPARPAATLDNTSLAQTLASLTPQQQAQALASLQVIDSVPDPAAKQKLLKDFFAALQGMK